MKKLILAVIFLPLCGLVPAASAFEPPIAIGKKAKKKASEHAAGPDAKKTPSDEGFTFGPDKKIRFEVDSESERNQITFTSKAPKETIKGTVSTVTGYLEINPRKIDAAEGKFTVEWKDVTVPKKAMDEHMKADPWVNTASYPQIVFTVTGIEENHLQAKNKKLSTFKTKLMGDWEMNGKKQELTIPVTLSYIEADKDKPDVKEVLGIKTTFKIKLEDFGIQGRPGAIGTAVAPMQSIKLSLVMARTDQPDESADAEEEKPAKKPKPKPAPKKPRPQGI